MTPGDSRLTLAVSAALVGMCASTVQQSLLATATPTIVATLGHLGLYGWVSGLYLAASVAVLPVAGVLADRLGPRPLFLAGMGAFAAGTAGACLAPAMGWLLLARAVQGVGAGLLVPAALAVVGLVEGERARGRVFGAMGLAQVAANVAGPVWGGWATEAIGWRWAMAATTPLVVAGWALAAASMLALPRPPRWWQVSRQDLAQPAASRPMAGLLAVTFLVSGVTVAVLTWLPWALQALHGLDAADIGHRLVPMLLASAIGSAAGGANATRPKVLPGCWLVVLTGLLLASRGDVTSLVVAAAGVGFGCGAVLPVLLTRIQSAAGPGRVAAASSLAQLARHGGAAVLVPTAGLWPAMTPADHAAAGLLFTFVMVAISGLVISWRIS